MCTPLTFWFLSNNSTEHRALLYKNNKMTAAVFHRWQWQKLVLAGTKPSATGRCPWAHITPMLSDQKHVFAQYLPFSHALRGAHR